MAKGSRHVKVGLKLLRPRTLLIHFEAISKKKLCCTNAFGLDIPFDSGPSFVNLILNTEFITANPTPRPTIMAQHSLGHTLVLGIGEFTRECVAGFIPLGTGSVADDSIHVFVFRRITIGSACLVLLGAAAERIDEKVIYFVLYASYVASVDSGTHTFSAHLIGNQVVVVLEPNSYRRCWPFKPLNNHESRSTLRQPIYSLPKTMGNASLQNSELKTISQMVSLRYGTVVPNYERLAVPKMSSSIDHSIVFLALILAPPSSQSRTKRTIFDPYQPVVLFHMGKTMPDEKQTSYEEFKPTTTQIYEDLSWQ
ncbi:hypothetical protein DFH07DRAFT_771597 [Mycena maculata]|uniref:Uncharacterized protein n=1 Tax=Mycena maculata TaxID=230809 RepID=A0AAD7NI08_9AGAR|nr:hypothetical protein DFH07DRAFT_771597 [Mycena maculata]